MDRFTNQILAFIRQQDLLKPGDGVLVGFSGGADSSCLLRVLAGMTRLLGIELYAAHVNHNLRGAEAQRDEAFCRSTAAELGIPFFCVSVQVREKAAREGLSLEEAARLLRYKALEELRQRLAAERKGPVVIAAAHHAGDQAETILLNLFRGSGLRGLGGMAPARDRLVRPLLCVSRADILVWMEQKGFPYVTDSTNLCEDCTRNFLRNRLLPLIREGINQRAEEHILAAGQRCSEADRYLRQEAEAFCREETSLSGDCILIPRRRLKEKPQIFRRYVIIEALTRLGVPLKDFGEPHIAQLDRALSAGKGFHLDLPNRVFAENRPEYTAVCLREQRDENKKQQE